jgi:signal transduction histidine kinase
MSDSKPPDASSPGRGRWLGWVTLVGYWAFAAAGFALGSLTDPSVFPVPQEFSYRIFFGAFATVGALIVLRRPANRVGRILCWIGLISGVASFVQPYCWYALVHANGALPGGLAAGWMGSWLYYPAAELFLFLLLLFPDGRLPTPGWRPVSWAAAATMVVTSVWAAFAPRALESPPFLPNPLGIQQASALFEGIGLIGFLAAVLLVLLCLWSVVFRFRRSRGETRQQLQWFTYGVALAVAVWAINQYLFRSAGADWPQAAQIPIILSLPGLIAPAVAIGIAILKYRLYDIDRLISRSLVYAGLTAAVIGVYVAVVQLLGAVFEHRGLGTSLVATGLVAVGFQPARERLQRSVDRLLYGQRDDPYAVLSRLGQRLEATLAPEALLPSLVDTVAQALRLPYVAVEVPNDNRQEIAASIGRQAGQLTRLPLSYQGELVGQLTVAPRSPGERLAPADRRLLADVARHAGVAVHALRLTAELQRSRERLVSAREEERRRLRRDLHDGLGPTLAGVVLQLGAARTLANEDPPAASALLERLQTEVKGAIVEIRRLVYQLRPPALDELGLTGALREQASHFSHQQPSDSGTPTSEDHLVVTIDTPAELPPLPAAVEVAAYRIATEALTNIARHADANRCTVRLALDGALELEVSDDGNGLPTDFRIGVGLTSMRERAAELGGSCTILSASDGGTRVHARLPIPQEA